MIKYINKCILKNFSYFALHSGLPEQDLIARNHSRLSKYQRSVLELSFAVHSSPNTTTLKKLAFQTGLSKAKLARWFIAKRHYKKKETFKGRLCKYQLLLYENYACMYVTCQCHNAFTNAFIIHFVVTFQCPRIHSSNH